MNKRQSRKVLYQPRFGSFRKLPRDTVRKIILAEYDSSPITGTALLRHNLNLRLKGATIEEFLQEREVASPIYSQA